MLMGVDGEENREDQQCNEHTNVCWDTGGICQAQYSNEHKQGFHDYVADDKETKNKKSKMTGTTQASSL